MILYILRYIEVLCCTSGYQLLHIYIYIYIISTASQPTGLEALDLGAITSKLTDMGINASGIKTVSQTEECEYPEYE